MTNRKRSEHKEFHFICAIPYALNMAILRISEPSSCCVNLLLISFYADFMGVLNVMYEKENTFNVKKMITNPYDKSPSKKETIKKVKR